MRSRDRPFIEGTAALRLIRPVLLAGCRPGRIGRPCFVPTLEQRHQVEALAGYGLTTREIATVIINPQTGLPLSQRSLHKFFQRELDVGRIKANAAIAGNLFRIALGNGAASVRACIWWTKARMGWRGSGPSEKPHFKRRTGGATDLVPDGLDRVKAELRRLVEQREGNVS